MDQDRLAAYVRAAQGGSLPDFEVLVHRFQDMAVGYSRVLLNDFHLADRDSARMTDWLKEGIALVYGQEFR